MAVTSCYHRTTIIKRPLFCNILTSLDMWPLSVGITTSINFQMTLALAKLEPCGLCSRKFTGLHEGNKMDVIGSFDHSFIIESRRERLHATHNLSKQSGPPTKSCWNLLREFSETSCSFGHKSVEYRHFHPKNRNFHVLCNQMEWSPWKATELEGCLLLVCWQKKYSLLYSVICKQIPQRCRIYLPRTFLPMKSENFETNCSFSFNLILHYQLWWWLLVVPQKLGQIDALFNRL